MNTNNETDFRWQNAQLRYIAEMVGNDSGLLAGILNKIAPAKVSPNGGWVLLTCPQCKTNNLKIRVVGRTYSDELYWECYQCKKKLSDKRNLTGLVRLFTGLNINDATNLVFDAAFKEKRPSEIVLPAEKMGAYAGRKIEELRPSEIYYLIEEGKSEALTEHVKLQLEDYLTQNRMSGILSRTIELPSSIPLKTEIEKPAHKTSLDATPVVFTRKESFNFKKCRH